MKMKKKLLRAFSTAIFYGREKKQLTQEQVAEAVDISVRWYQELEKGTQPPGAETMLKLMILFDLNPQDFKEEADVVEFLPICPHGRDPKHRRNK